MSDLLDRDALGQLKDFIQGKFTEVVEVYLRSSAGYVQGVQDGFAAQDAKAVADNAHPLKSSSGNLGLVAMQALAEEIEDLAHAVLAGEQHSAALAPLVEKTGSVYEASAALLKAELA